MTYDFNKPSISPQLPKLSPLPFQQRGLVFSRSRHCPHCRRSLRERSVSYEQTKQIETTSASPMATLIRLASDRICEVRIGLFSFTLPWRSEGRHWSCAFLASVLGVVVYSLMSLSSALGDEPTSIDPNQLVLQAVQRAVWGPALSCRMRQISELGDQQIEVEGQYWHMGQGSGQMKMVLEWKGAQPAKKSQWTQISDGRLLWTNMGTKEPPRRVYLDRVRQSLGSMIRDPNGHPEAALYLAIGGQAESLRCLYFRYRWFKVYAGNDVKGRAVWQLVGTLRNEMPKPCSVTNVDGMLVIPNPTAEVPTDVRLTLGRDEKLSHFPYKIDYYRREKSEDGLPGRLVHLSTIENDEVVSPISVPRDFFQFQVPDAADQIDDETNDYMPQIPLADAGPAIRR